MSSFIPSNRSWDQAEVLVVQWEQTSRQSSDAESLYGLVVNDLGEFSDASVSLWAEEGDRRACLASDHHTHPGSPLPGSHRAATPRPPLHDFAPAVTWAPPEHSRSARLEVHQRIAADLVLSISLGWSSEERVVDLDHTDRLTIADVAKAAIEIIGMVFLRQQLSAARQKIARNDQRAMVVAEIYRGATLRDAFHNAAKAWARHIDADRVSVLRSRGNQFRLISTSVHPKVDRRSRTSFLLEALAAEAQRHDEAIAFTAGQPSSQPIASQASLQRYIIESGCRRLELEFVERSAGSEGPVAVIVSEWFAASNTSPDPLFRKHVHEAVRGAVDREANAWTALAQRASEAQVRNKMALAGLVLAGSLLALWLIPVRFTLPADGRVVPEVHRRLFAPAEAIVSQVDVHNGQIVKQGDSLFTLRSSALELHDEQLRGELITAKTQLASLGASRSGPKRGAADTGVDALSISADEESLKVQITGLEKQLALIAKQKSELSITSPIDGKVDRWDLEQSLSLRPVAQGQYLADVYSLGDSWTAELDLPDKHAGYLLQDNGVAQGVMFRLQAQPDEVFHGTIVDVANATAIDSQNRSVIRLKCAFTPAQPERLAIGATVWAEVDCGRRSLGFVWFRGLIEWFERQSWY